MKIAAYLIVMAGVTYLIRAIPFTLFRRKVKSEFVRYFLEFIPYAVLGAMTVPWIFEAGAHPICAGVALVVAIILAYFERSLITVAVGACVAAFITGLFF